MIMKRSAVLFLILMLLSSTLAEPAPAADGITAESPYMQAAIEEALEGIALRHGGPFGAVIVRDGRIVGRGHNRVLADNDPTCHGEIAAIRDACKSLGTYDLTGCELYTTGEPCPMCLFACLWANISRVYFGCTLEDNAAIGSSTFTLFFSGNLKNPFTMSVHKENLGGSASKPCRSSSLCPFQQSGR